MTPTVRVGIAINRNRFIVFISRASVSGNYIPVCWREEMLPYEKFNGYLSMTIRQ